MAVVTLRYSTSRIPGHEGSSSDTFLTKTADFFMPYSMQLC